MEIKPSLSICIPVFNRKNELSKLLKSIDIYKGIEVVIIDDGSKDGVQNFLKKKNYKFKIFFSRTTKNRGRSSALADAIKYSSGKYIIIMDSDDYFLPGAINLIKQKLKRFRNIGSLIFGVKIFKNGNYINNLPPSNIKTNLLKLRADFKVKGDLKEVVRADFLKKSIYKKAYNFRRSPTSLMWFFISNITKTITINIPIIIKKYDMFGMTNNISKLKFENPEPMCDLYYNYSISKLYNSNFFRIRSKIQFYRYLFLSKKKLEIKRNEILFILIGYSLYIYDLLFYKFYKKLTH
jgi:glycosyltransferase involved in cell wall biosynthesis